MTKKMDWIKNAKIRRTQHESRELAKSEKEKADAKRDNDIRLKTGAHVVRGGGNA